MPNWVYNRVHGSKKVCELLLGSDRRPTFLKVVPTPRELEELDNLPDQTMYEAYADYLFNDDKKLKELYKTRKLNKEFKTFDSFLANLSAKYPLQKMFAVRDLQKKYGVTNWYDFNCKYYGCKWDARELYSDPYPTDIDEIEFETPWSPPDGVMDKIAKMLPDEQFTWHCDEESCAFSFDSIYPGDGTRYEEDSLPEYYMPYIIDEEQLVDECKNITKASTLLNAIECAFPEGCDFSVKEDEAAKTITVTVYNWENYGGEELYSHVFKNIDFEKEER